MKKDPELEAMKNEQLEFLSDQIRKGIPVGMLEAIAVIEYQKKLQRERERIREGKWWYRFWKKIKGLYDKARQS